MAKPPIGDPEGQDRVDNDRAQGHGSKSPVQPRRHHPHGQDQFQGGRTQAEHHAADQEVRRPRTTFDDPGQGAGLLALMKVERQSQGMAKCLGCRLGHGRLRHRCKDRLPRKRCAGRDQSQARKA